MNEQTRLFPRLLSEREAAQYVGCGRTIFHSEWRPFLRIVPTGTRQKYDVKELDDLIEKKKRPAIVRTGADLCHKNQTTDTIKRGFPGSGSETASTIYDANTSGRKFMEQLEFRLKEEG